MCVLIICIIFNEGTFLPSTPEKISQGRPAPLHSFPGVIKKLYFSPSKNFCVSSSSSATGEATEYLSGLLVSGRLNLFSISKFSFPPCFSRWGCAKVMEVKFDYDLPERSLKQELKNEKYKFEEKLKVRILKG